MALLKGLIDSGNSDHPGEYIVERVDSFKNVALFLAGPAHRVAVQGFGLGRACVL